MCFSSHYIYEHSDKVHSISSRLIHYWKFLSMRLTSDEQCTSFDNVLISQRLYFYSFHFILFQIITKYCKMFVEIDYKLGQKMITNKLLGYCNFKSFYYILGQLLHFKELLLHFKAVFTF